jgi:hypothetical protein
VIDQQPVLPPRGGACEHAGRFLRDTLIDRGDQRLGLIERHEPCRARHIDFRKSARVFARHVDLRRHRSHAVAELAVNRIFGGPEHRDRFAARMRVIDHRSLHGAQETAAAVRRQDTDHGHARGLHLPARHGQIERKRSRARDRGIAVERRMHPLRFEHAEEMLDRVLGRRQLAEIMPDRRKRGAHLRPVGAHTHLHDTAL